MIGINEYLVLL